MLVELLELVVLDVLDVDVLELLEEVELLLLDVVELVVLLVVVTVVDGGGRVLVVVAAQQGSTSGNVNAFTGRPARSATLRSSSHTVMSSAHSAARVSSRMVAIGPVPAANAPPDRSTRSSFTASVVISGDTVARHDHAGLRVPHVVDASVSHSGSSRRIASTPRTGSSFARITSSCTGVPTVRHAADCACSVTTVAPQAGTPQSIASNRAAVPMIAARSSRSAMVTAPLSGSGMELGA